ncbi:hypothetical protein SNEBB_004701 [Seison nebaliae]|nr:hypothetical protein SNEBB_004701 [Seison nebaliae]
MDNLNKDNLRSSNFSYVGRYNSLEDRRIFKNLNTIDQYFLTTLRSTTVQVKPVNRHQRNKKNNNNKKKKIVRSEVYLKRTSPINDQRCNNNGNYVKKHKLENIDDDNGRYNKIDDEKKSKELKLFKKVEFISNSSQIDLLKWNNELLMKHYLSTIKHFC